MPIYFYECEDCGEKFEILVGVVNSSKKLICPKCKSENLKKLLSTFGVRIGNFSTGSSDISSICPTGTCPASGIKEE